MMTTEIPSDAAARSNVPEMSVSELSFSLKRTLEETYGRIRVRGELSRVKVAASGHMYSDLKDENSVINVICWKGTLSKMDLQPEEGMDVICTGRISTYPARSNYQLIIEKMELAGEGALLKLLEERKRKLAAEGLFDPARKKDLPFLPQTIGVVTSPTGAVIRDIMHRLDDRFPRHVLLYPVLVQGQGAADQITNAIRKFDMMKGTDDLPRPDVLIVARGGGSLEDLMAFNEENVVRAAAACSIPLISAVGHETDTTLIDFVADQRAPTPTGAAEIAVPRRADLIARLSETSQRLFTAMSRHIEVRKDRTENFSKRLGDPQRLLENKTQKFDNVTQRLSGLFERRLSAARERLVRYSAQIRHPQYLVNDAQRRLEDRVSRLPQIGARIVGDHKTRLQNVAGLLEAYAYTNVLKRGYAVVRDEAGKPLGSAKAAAAHNAMSLEFHDGLVDVHAAGQDAPPNPPPQKAKPKKKAAPAKKQDSGSTKADQGSLF